MINTLNTQPIVSVFCHSHAGKPTATMTSVWSVVREALGGSYSRPLESNFLWGFEMRHPHMV